MKNAKYQIIVMFCAVLCFTACEVVDPLASEQYEKNIYIVGANERVYAFDLPYGNEQDAFVSISASGTQKVDQDVVVTLKQNDEIINWYNNKYMLDAPVKYQQIDMSLVDISSWTTTLKAGEIYTRFPFTINSLNLHCDSLYAIGLAIESVSHYQLSELGTELIFTLILTNDYSGNYQLDASKTLLREETLPDGSSQWIEQGLALPVSIQRTLKATSPTTVRFFHEKTKETLAEYSNSWDPGKDYFDAIRRSCIQFVHIADNRFAVEPWDEMEILEGEAIYDDSKFEFWYDYMDGSSRYRIRGVFRK